MAANEAIYYEKICTNNDKVLRYSGTVTIEHDSTTGRSRVVKLLDAYLN